MTQYSSDGKGNWWKTVWEEQCPEFVGIGGILAERKAGEGLSMRQFRCQGVKGHKGVHWRYAPSGWLEWDDNEDDPTEDGCSGSTPPDHKTYRTPQRMLKHHWREHKTTTKVTDPEKIAQLERGEYEEGASIDKPVDFDEMDPETRDEIQDRLGILKKDLRLFVLGEGEDTIPIVTIDARDVRFELGQYDHGGMDVEVWSRVIDEGPMVQIKNLDELPADLHHAIPFGGEVDGCMYDYTCLQWCQMMDKDGAIQFNG